LAGRAGDSGMSPLPAGFEALAPFVAQWAVAGSARRAAARSQATLAQCQDFYDAIQPLAEAALAYLDRKALAEHDAAETRLMNLCLSLAHVAMAVEAQGEVEAGHTPHRDQMVITHTVADG
jgi:hypothetical protein